MRGRGAGNSVIRDINNGGREFLRTSRPLRHKINIKQYSCVKNDGVGVFCDLYTVWITCVAIFTYMFICAKRLVKMSVANLYTCKKYYQIMP